MYNNQVYPHYFVPFCLRFQYNTSKSPGCPKKEDLCGLMFMLPFCKEHSNVENRNHILKHSCFRMSVSGAYPYDCVDLWTKSLASPEILFTALNQRFFSYSPH